MADRVKCPDCGHAVDVLLVGRYQRKQERVIPIHYRHDRPVICAGGGSAVRNHTPRRKQP